MNATEVLNLRLHTQRLAGAWFDRPEDVVRWLVGVQSQDYPGARWSLGQRTNGCTDADVAAAFNEGRILRTHVLRPTWHFVVPEDIRTLLKLTASRVHALNAYSYRRFQLDAATLARSQTLIADALGGGRRLTRPELADVLQRVGIVADGLRLSYIVMHAELDALICSGAMRGKQHTYALLDERAPAARELPHDEALAEITRRFFTGHGPATLREYVRWSGLTVADARQGLRMVERDLERADVEGETSWCGDSVAPPVPQPKAIVAYLLPEYDECVLTYTGLTFPDMPLADDRQPWHDTFYRPVIIGGRRAGTWRRTIAKRRVLLEMNLFARLDPVETAALEAAAKRYGAFLNMPATVSYL